MTKRGVATDRYRGTAHNNNNTGCCHLWFADIAHLYPPNASSCTMRKTGSPFVWCYVWQTKQHAPQINHGITELWYTTKKLLRLVPCDGTLRFFWTRASIFYTAIASDESVWTCFRPSLKRARSEIAFRTFRGLSACKRTSSGKVGFCGEGWLTCTAKANIGAWGEHQHGARGATGNGRPGWR